MLVIVVAIYALDVPHNIPRIVEVLYLITEDRCEPYVQDMLD
jgi:hypothetical protein